MARTMTMTGAPPTIDRSRSMSIYDHGLLAAVIMLMGVGVLMVYSASIYTAEQNMGNGNHYLFRQLLNVGVGCVGLLAGMFIHYHRIRRLVYPLLCVSIIMLFILLIPGLGTTVGRSTRWFRFAYFSFQPSELAKFAFVAWLAYSLEKKNEKIRSFTVGFLPHLLVAGLIMGLSLAQPDFGTCMILAAIMVSLLYIAGTRISYILLLFFAAIPIIVKYVVLNSTRAARMVAFLDPWEHRYDIGYQTVNSLAAFGSGGMTGMGLGASRQKFGYIPEAQTDFIFPILGEEFGFVGVLCIIAIFAFVVARGIAIAWNARDDFGRYLAFGISLLIGLQAAVNMGVSLNLLPTKGLTLPFISFGGTSLLVAAFSVGVLLNISRWSQMPVDAEPPVPQQRKKNFSEKRRKKSVSQTTQAVREFTG